MLLDIYFKNEQLREECNNQRQIVRHYGQQGAKLLRRRLDDLAAAENLAVMRKLPGRCHELTEDRAGQLALDLDGGRRLIIEVANEPPPRKDDSGLDWTKVTAIRILEVKDYH